MAGVEPTGLRVRAQRSPEATGAARLVEKLLTRQAVPRRSYSAFSPDELHWVRPEGKAIASDVWPQRLLGARYHGRRPSSGRIPPD
jgi:hypothetical protein